MKRLGSALIPFVISEVCLLTFFALFVYLFLPYAFIRLMLSVIIVYTFVKLIYAHFSHAHIIGFSVLLVTTYILFVCASLNISTFCDSSSFYAPVLQNEDSAKFYDSAKFILNNNWNVPIQYYYGFPYLISLLWSITGVSIIGPMMLNIFMTLMSVCMAGLIANRVFNTMPADKRAFISGVSMLCTAAVCFYIGCGTVILKEPMIYLGVTLALYSMLGLREPNPTKGRVAKDISLFVLSVLMLFLTRHGAVILMLVGILFFTRKYNIKRAVAMAVIGIAGLFATYMIVNNSSDRDADIVTGQNLEASDYLSDNADGTRQAFNRSMEGYFSYPAWKKAAYLPYTASVQYFIPFIWTSHNSVAYGQAQVYSHFGFFWYIVGGLALFFILFFRKFKSTPRGLVLLLIIGILGYIIPAYLFAGSVSRYWLPFTPIYAIVAAWVIDSARENLEIRSLLKKYLPVYAVIVAVVLVSCYFITTA